MEFFSEHWIELVLALITFAGTYTALTATKKDDEILDIISRIFNAIILGKSTCKKDCKENCEKECKSKS
tara:strand:- start:2599 stop:2805 length:207 start_codon:yes stop_codon:yes gene_type:complete